jgi:hypothetical protein
MNDVVWITVLLSLLMTGLGLGFHFWARPPISRSIGVVWPPSGSSLLPRRWPSGEALSRFSVGVALLFTAPAGALGIAFARPEALDAAWIFVPQRVIGLVMAITAWPEVRPRPLGRRARIVMLIGLVLWIVPLIAWFFGLLALGQPLGISLVGGLALGFATAQLALLVPRMVVALRVRRP